jgi:hypothetical protein
MKDWALNSIRAFKNFYYHQNHNDPGAHPASYITGIKGSFPKGTPVHVGHSQLTSTHN